MRILFQYTKFDNDSYDYLFELMFDNNLTKYDFYRNNNQEEHTYLGKFGK